MFIQARVRGLVACLCCELGTRNCSCSTVFGCNQGRSNATGVLYCSMRVFTAPHIKPYVYICCIHTQLAFFIDMYKELLQHATSNAVNTGPSGQI